MNASLRDLRSPACSTSSIIRETVLSPNALTVRTLTAPVWFTQPERISSPWASSRGTLSPVRALVSTEVDPSSITPSSGTFSPGRTIMTSPASTSPGLTSTVAPSRSTWARSGRMSIRWAMLSRLRPSAKPSNSSPTWKNSITNTASWNAVSAPGRKPMQSAPTVATVIRKCSSKGSPCAMPSAASSKVSWPMSRYGTR